MPSFPSSSMNAAFEYPADFAACPNDSRPVSKSLAISSRRASSTGTSGGNSTRNSLMVPSFPFGEPQGSGFPIGGLAAMDPDHGVISPGGIGFDINCGMRLVRTDLTFDEIRDRVPELIDALYKRVPAGVGARGFLTLSDDDFRAVATQGA